VYNNATTRFGSANQVAAWTNVNVPFKYVSDRLKTSQNLALYFVEQESGSVRTKERHIIPISISIFKKMLGPTRKFPLNGWRKLYQEAVKDEDRFVLFCDNLTGQVVTEFKEPVAKLGGVVWYGLPGATDLWQPVDAGYAQILKTLIGQAQRKWLDDEENAEKWYGHETSFSAKERRIRLLDDC